MPELWSLFERLWINAAEHAARCVAELPAIAVVATSSWFEDSRPEPLPEKIGPRKAVGRSGSARDSAA